MQRESMKDLIKQAIQMYNDRTKEENDLIYHIAKMDNESKTALILAYEILYKIKDD